MTEEHTKKESAVAKYNKCIDEAMAALAEVVKEEGPGGWLVFRECGRHDAPVGGAAFTSSRSSVKVRPGVIPMRVGTGSLFCKLAGPSGNVEE
jgi:hypothetical protein